MEGLEVHGARQGLAEGVELRPHGVQEEDHHPPLLGQLLGQLEPLGDGEDQAQGGVLVHLTPRWVGEGLAHAGERAELGQGPRGQGGEPNQVFHLALLSPCRAAQVEAEDLGAVSDGGLLAALGRARDAGRHVEDAALHRLQLGGA